MFHEQAVGSLDRDSQPRSGVQYLIEGSETFNIVTHSSLQDAITIAIDQAQLMIAAAPIDAGEHVTFGGDSDRTHVAPSQWQITNALAASSEPHLGAHGCGAAPAGRSEARHHRERTGLRLDLEGDTFA